LRGGHTLRLGIRPSKRRQPRPLPVGWRRLKTIPPRSSHDLRSLPQLYVTVPIDAGDPDEPDVDIQGCDCNRSAVGQFVTKMAVVEWPPIATDRAHHRPGVRRRPPCGRTTPSFLSYRLLTTRGLRQTYFTPAGRGRSASLHVLPQHPIRGVPRQPRRHDRPFAAAGPVEALPGAAADPGPYLAGCMLNPTAVAAVPRRS
jgi:hypothetical protein